MYKTHTLTIYHSTDVLQNHFYRLLTKIKFFESIKKDEIYYIITRNSSTELMDFLNEGNCYY